eukprot:TRINITY_DN7254_c0_g1_i2.p2 TRINITY_DN7254_c0_g1~~TRINITY_DN7254_c0_g1_i2.p2  ORF type:complete len:213 (-),score=69.98 TRINITY_DN7254_c0_g1_i2:876-1490(-)
MNRFVPSFSSTKRNHRNKGCFNYFQFKNPVGKREKSTSVIKGPKSIVITKSTSLNEVESILSEMTKNQKENVKSKAHSHVASSLFRLGKITEGMEIMNKMRQEGYVPHRDTFVSWAYCCSKLKNLESTHDLLNALNINGPETPPVTIHKHLIKNVIIAMIKSGDKQSAQILMINYCSIFEPNDEIFELMLNNSADESELEMLLD